MSFTPKKDVDVVPSGSEETDPKLVSQYTTQAQQNTYTYLINTTIRTVSPVLVHDRLKLSRTNQEAQLRLNILASWSNFNFCMYDTYKELKVTMEIDLYLVHNTLCFTIFLVFSSFAYKIRKEGTAVVLTEIADTSKNNREST